jgi:hypothetical protein
VRHSPLAAIAAIYSAGVNFGVFMAFRILVSLYRFLSLHCHHLRRQMIQ